MKVAPPVGVAAARAGCDEEQAEHHGLHEVVTEQLYRREAKQQHDNKLGGNSG